MRKIIFVITTFITIFIITACGQTQAIVDAQPIDEAAEGLHYITVTHRSGTTDVPVNPQNIIVFDMGVLDSINVLGLINRVIGFPMSSVPERLAYLNLADFYDFGTLHEPNFEDIVAHQIDLIIISGRARPHFDELSQIAPTIDLGLDINDMLGTFLENNRYIGQIFEMEHEVDYILNNLTTQIAEISQIASENSKRALVILHNEGQLRAFGSMGRFGIIHDYFGFDVVDADIEIINHGELVSSEYIVNQNPDILFIIDRNYAVGDTALNREDIENELIQLTVAYQNNNIFYLTSDVWYISPGGLQGMQIQIDDLKQAVN